MSEDRDLPLGIYWRLPEAPYHADRALGSGDVRRLAVSPFDFWWAKQGWMPREDTTPLIVGRAYHTAVLEGLEKFRRHYARKEAPWTTKTGKAEKAVIEAAGLIGIDSDDYDRISMAATVIRTNPHLKGAFDGGMPEVSVLWERDGIKRKARLDYLKVRAITDLKSIRNSRDIDFREACRRRFADARYDVQAAHYLEARAAMAGFIRDGRVYGDAPSDFVSAIASSDQAAFVFVFFQAEGAPLTWGLTLSPGNPILEIGRRTIEIAERNWTENNARFAPGEPWLMAEPLSELDINELPQWWGR